MPPWWKDVLDKVTGKGKGGPKPKEPKPEPTPEAQTVQTEINMPANPASPHIVQGAAPTPPPPDPTPPPPGGDPPPPTTGKFLIGMTHADILALPTSGAGWNQLVSNSNNTINVDLVTHSNLSGGDAFCAALRYLRTGETAYYNKVITALNTVQSKNVSLASDGYYSAVARQVQGYVLAADLVGHRTSAWMQWVRDVRFKDVPGHSSWGGMWKAATRAVNNHGASARVSLLACNLFVGDVNQTTPFGTPGGVLQDYKFLRGFLGEPTYYGSAVGTNSAPPFGRFAVGGSLWQYSQTWMHNSAQDVWTGINPANAIPSKEGALVAEIVRENTAYSVDGSGKPIPGTSLGYSYHAGSAAIHAATLLAAAGYTDVWQWSNQALRRWREFLHRYNFQNPHSGAFKEADPMINHIYGTSYPYVDVRAYGLSATRWLTQKTNWLKP